MTHVLPFHRLSARWMIAGMYEVLKYWIEVLQCLVA